MGLAETLAADRRQRLIDARRRLLVNPLVHRAEEPELFTTLLALREELTRWFMEVFGWRLVVDATGGFARLRKVPARPDPTRPARVNDTALSPRKYTLMFLACAALDAQPTQTTLSVLSEAVRELSASEENIRTFDPHNRHGDRLAFAGALKWLEAQGMIAVRDGNVDDYRQDPNANALLDVNDRLLAHLLTCPTSPALVGDAADILSEAYPAGADGRARWAGHQIRRRLAEDPVIYYTDLSKDERAWLGPRWRLVYQLADDLGLVIERRAEGLAAVDPDASTQPLTDVRFPRAGATASHAALLLAEYLAARRPRRCDVVQASVRPRSDPVDPVGNGDGEADLESVFVVTRSDIVHHLSVCIDEYASRCGWASWTTEDGGAERLADEATEYLAAFGLVKPVNDLVMPTPAIARFAAKPPSSI